jgi:transcriptional regulator with XRE-family HTH domain
MRPTELSLRELFGRRVQSLRKSRGLTQEILAERVGISIDFLSLIERGRNSPSFDNLEQFGRAFGLPVSDLFIFSGGSDEGK